MRRREFITLIGGAAAACPVVARAQQPMRMRRIGLLMSVHESDPVAQAKVTAFRDGLQKLGWTEGRNIQIDYRWGVDGAELTQRVAKEVVALKPDVILSANTPMTASVLRQTSSIPIIFANVSDPAGIAASQWGGVVSEIAEGGYEGSVRFDADGGHGALGTSA